MTDRIVHEEEKELARRGYKFLGVNPHGAPELIHCNNEGHPYHSSFPNVRRRVEHLTDGSDITDWCTICRIYWKTDITA